MPVLTVTGAGVRHRGRWLFRDLDAAVEPGELVAVVGVPGSGRTTVVLALAQRFRLSAGNVELSGPAALGHVPDVEQPEPVFSVAEHVRERLALLGRPAREAGEAELYGLDPGLKGWQLTPYQKQLLGLALARLAEPALIVLDGLDDGLDSVEQEELWRVLGELAAAGVAVVVTAREVDPQRVATVIRLGDPQAPAGLPDRSESPEAKSPEAKSPVAKSPVAKSPVAKSPVATVIDVDHPEPAALERAAAGQVAPERDDDAEPESDALRAEAGSDAVRAEDAPGSGHAVGASGVGHAEPGSELLTGDGRAGADATAEGARAEIEKAGEQPVAGAEGAGDGEKR